MKIDGQQLKKFRELRGFSTRQLAQRIGVQHSTIVRWERGEADPRPQHVRALAYALHVGIHKFAEVSA